MNKIKILIAEDHVIVREGLIAALEIEPQFEVIAEAGNGIEAIEEAEKNNPDIIIMDIDMPKLDGLAAAKKIKGINPEKKILILTMYNNNQFILDALSCGVDGFVFKMADMEELHKAIKLISEGETYFDEKVKKMINTSAERTKTFKSSVEEMQEEYGISDREKEIIQLISRGYTSNKIAEELVISPHTVKNHRKNILQKLELTNTYELISFAIKHGLH